MKKNGRNELWKARNFGVGECTKENAEQQREESI